MIDTHVHVVNFLQHVGNPDDLARQLTDGTLSEACVFGLPVKKKWAASEPMAPTYYLDDNAPCGTYTLTDELVVSFLDEVGAVRDRLAPLMCGFDPTDLLAVEHVERMASRFAGWRGVGEVLLRHDDLTELTYGENARAGHPALDPVLEVCADRGWPFSFHQDSSSAGRWSQHEYVGEVTSMLRRHPRVRFVWCHAGVGRRLHPHGQARMLADLLTEHPNLHLDLSWAVTDEMVSDPDAGEGWLRLVREHPDRFVLGSDVTGSFTDIADTRKVWQRFGERLPAEAAGLLGSGNARRLWFEG